MDVPGRDQPGRWQPQPASCAGQSEDLERWGRGRPPEDLVRRAFEFLLEREEPRQILGSFDLAGIARYFPEFPRVISET